MTEAINEPVLLRRDDGRVAIPHVEPAEGDERRCRRASSTPLQAEFDKLVRQSEIRCVVIEAAGCAFCAGHDLREVRSTDDYGFHHDLLTRCSAMMMAIRRLPQPVIDVHAIAPPPVASCRGCDLAIASADAKFATPGVNIGLFCGTPSVTARSSMSAPSVPRHVVHRRADQRRECVARWP